MDQLHLKIVTPEREVYDDTCEMVLVPSSQGQIGILPHHTHLMSKVSPGTIHIKKDNKETLLAVGEGVVEVADGQVTIMSDMAAHGHEIDEDAALEAQERARRALQGDLPSEEYAATLAALEKATAQLHVKRRHHRGI